MADADCEVNGDRPNSEVEMPDDEGSALAGHPPEAGSDLDVEPVDAGPPVLHHGALSVEAPASWFFKESITILAPDGRANVIASTEPLDPDIDLVQYYTVQGDLLTAEFPGYEERFFGEVGIVGIPVRTYIREFSWTPPDSQSVAQMQLYAVAAGRGITATGTTPVEEFERYRDVLFDILSSLVYDASSAAEATAPAEERVLAES